MRKKNKELKCKFDLDMDVKKILSVWGRPEAYSEEACTAIIEAAARGEHMDGWALAAGARSRQTLYNWEEKHPEFKEALSFAKLVNKVYYEKLGTEAVKGNIEGFSSGAWAITMNNKFSDEYRQTGQSTMNTSTTNNINFNTLNLSDSEKVARAKSLIYQLKIAGHELGNIGNDVLDVIDAEDENND